MPNNINIYHLILKKNLFLILLNIFIHLKPYLKTNNRTKKSSKLFLKSNISLLSMVNFIL